MMQEAPTTSVTPRPTSAHKSKRRLTIANNLHAYTTSERSCDCCGEWATRKGPRGKNTLCSRCGLAYLRKIKALKQKQASTDDIQQAITKFIEVRTLYVQYKKRITTFSNGMPIPMPTPGDDNEYVYPTYSSSDLSSQGFGEFTPLSGWCQPSPPMHHPWIELPPLAHLSEPLNSTQNDTHKTPTPKKVGKASLAFLLN